MPTSRRRASSLHLPQGGLADTVDRVEPEPILHAAARQARRLRGDGREDLLIGVAGAAVRPIGVGRQGHDHGPDADLFGGGHGAGRFAGHVDGGRRAALEGFGERDKTARARILKAS